MARTKRPDPKIRLNIELPLRWRDSLELMRQQLEADSNHEVIRRAVSTALSLRLTPGTTVRLINKDTKQDYWAALLPEREPRGQERFRVNLNISVVVYNHLCELQDTLSARNLTEAILCALFVLNTIMSLKSARQSIDLRDPSGTEQRFLLV